MQESLVKSHCGFLWLDRRQLMKQFLVLLVFTLGNEYRVRHHVLCVVVLGFGSSLCSEVGLLQELLNFYSFQMRETKRERE